jgi:hypothetical protein
VASVVGNQPYKVSLAVSEPEEVKARRQLMNDLAQSSGKPAEGSMLEFVQRRQLETYSTIDKLAELLRTRARWSSGCS